MSPKEAYKELFTNQVVKMVRSGKYLSEVEAVPEIQSWMKHLSPEARPRLVEIEMASKRELNNLIAI